MLNRFDRTHMVMNLKYILQMKNIRMEKFERNIGVSAGYFSRLDMDAEMADPSIDLILRITELLDITVETLLTSRLCPSQCLFTLQNFFERLYTQTYADQIMWKSFDVEAINRMLEKGDFSFPFIGTGRFNDCREDYIRLNYPSGSNMVSNGHRIYSPSQPNAILIAADTCFKLNAHDKAYYLIKFAEINYGGRKGDLRYAAVKEWYEMVMGPTEDGMYQDIEKDSAVYPVCSSRGDTSPLKGLMEKLYDLLKYHEYDPWIGYEVMKSIESYLQSPSVSYSNLEFDKDELPF